MEMMIASPGGKSEEELMKLQAKKQAVAQHAPLAQREKGMGEQIGDMAKEEAMNEGMSMGKEAAKPYMQGIKNAINPMGSAGAGAVAGQAATNAALASTPATMGMGGAQLGALTSAGAGTGAGLATGAGAGAGMAALGTAVPYIGAAMLAGKAFGLFNEGGRVGPLAQYKAEGGDTMSEEQKMLQNIMNIKQPELDPSKIGSARGGMTREQAMALMNNQPEPVQTMLPTQSIPMPQPRPINFPDPEELLQEMSMPQPMMRPQLQDPYGADRTYNPYDMLRPDNAPNT